MTTQESLPLQQLRVVEICSGLGVAAGYCGQLLADQGAEVVLVEPPEGRSLRRMPSPFAEGLFRSLNRNKSSITLDLASSSEACSEFLQLLRAVDILITELDPGEFDHIGLSAEMLSGPLKHLVVVELSGFGTSGPLSRWLGSDLVTTAFGGGCQQNGVPGRAPLRGPAYLGDHELGLNGAIAALIAWMAVSRDGKGQRIDLSGADCWATIHTGVGLLEFVFQGRTTMRAGRRNLGVPYPYTILKCQDGLMRLICIAGHEWMRALRMLGDPEWSKDARYRDRLRNNELYADELDLLLEQWLAGRTKDEIFELCRLHAVPWGPVRTIPEVLNDPQLTSRRYFWQDGKLHIPGSPFKYSRSDCSLRRAAPASGSHGDVLHGLVAPDRPAVSPSRNNEPPLAGIRVVDFGWAWAGGVCGAVLGDFGAEVIKVESLSRLDPMRTGRPVFSDKPHPHEQLPLHHNVNRNKLSVAIDIKHSRGVELVRQLVARSDILIENLSSNALAKSHLDYVSLAEANPRLIYLSMAAVGRTGPISDLRAYAPVLTGLAGMDALTGYPGEEPIGYSHGGADPNASLHGVFAILAALAERERSGRGQHIDLSQLECLVALLGGQLAAYQATGHMPRPEGNADPLMCPHGVYRTAGDDAWIAIACRDNREWQALRNLIDASAFRELEWDSLERRIEEQTRIDAWIESWTSPQERWALAERLQGAGIPAAPCMSPSDRFSDKHFASRETYVWLDHPVVGNEIIYGIPWKLERTPGRVRRRVPLLGEHTRAVLSEVLGLSAAEIAELDAEGVLK